MLTSDSHIGRTGPVKISSGTMIMDMVLNGKTNSVLANKNDQVPSLSYLSTAQIYIPSPSISVHDVAGRELTL